MINPAEYICPLCQQALLLANNSYRCQNNHCFDLAKEGYVNLLPVQFKHSKDPGDNKAMVNARRAFLQTGLYQPLANAINQLLQSYLTTPCKILDAGCGEGFYSHQFSQNKHQVYGVDIAKNAIRLAAKTYKQCHFSVGTLSKLPFADHFFNAIVSIYAPIITNEFYRLLTTKGILITVTPGAQHLLQLKQLIYQQAQLHDETREPIDNLTLVEQQKLSYPITLTSPEQIKQLLQMTPFAFKASEHTYQMIEQQKQLTCTVDFQLKLYQKS